MAVLSFFVKTPLCRSQPPVPVSRRRCGANAKLTGANVWLPYYVSSRGDSDFSRLAVIEFSKVAKYRLAAVLSIS